jgi:hypothetical protein
MERRADNAEPDFGLRFGLTDDAFMQWWTHALLKADADEFVHVLGGNRIGARFVCAIDRLVRLDGRGLTGDIIVRAYCVARKIPPAQFAAAMREPQNRLDAQCLYNDAAVQSLLDRLAYRSRQLSMERVALRTMSKIESLYQRADDETLDPEIRIDVEKAALNASVTLLSIDERRQSGEAKRRQQAAYGRALEASRTNMRDESAPPSIEEAKHFILMLREHFGADVLRDLVTNALPSPREATKEALTIEDP